MVTVTNEEEFARAVKNSEDTIVVTGDFADKLVKQKTAHAIGREVAAKTLGVLNPLAAISVSIESALLDNYDIAEKSDKLIVLKRR